MCNIGGIIYQPAIHASMSLPFVLWLDCELFLHVIGYFGITQQDCQNQGCCWAPADVSSPYYYSLSVCLNNFEVIPIVSVFYEVSLIKLYIYMHLLQNQPYCFRKSTPPPPTPTCLPDEYRFDCGMHACSRTYWCVDVCYHITLMHCIHRCCWNYPGAV